MEHDSQPTSNVIPTLGDNLDFRKSTFSGTTGGNCVEVAFASPEIAAVRDSKHPAVVLMVGREALVSLVATLQ